jgi:hypothetical protein
MGDEKWLEDVWVSRCATVVRELCYSRCATVMRELCYSAVKTVWEENYRAACVGSVFPCNDAFTTLFLNCNSTVFALLSHGCHIVVTLLSHCGYTVVTLWLHCCYTNVTLVPCGVRGVRVPLQGCLGEGEYSTSLGRQHLRVRMMCITLFFT